MTAGKGLAGRVAVVTGGGSGIGAAVARALAADGAVVVVCGRRVEALTGVVREIEGAGGQAHAIRCDVARREDVEGLAATVHERIGRPAILVNNAGIARSAPFGKTDEATWTEVLDVNLTGPYRTTRAFWDDLLAAGRTGRIINVASVAARIPFLYTSAYCASKHGLLGLTRVLALELAPKGPTANCVCPGWVDTDMAAQAVANIAAKTGRSAAEARGSLERLSPQARLMTPDEIAAVVRFLASDAAAGVTGQAWNVDGGEVMA